MLHNIRCIGADHLWTFTKRGKFADPDELWAVWKEFNRLMEIRFGDRWQYVAVPELHNDGVTWHLHAAVPGFFLVTTLRTLWHRALGGVGSCAGSDSPGNVDAKFIKGRGPRSIANYICKYVGKGFGSVATGRRVFSSSAGIRPLEQAYFHFTDWATYWEMRETLGAFLAQRFPGVDFGCTWYGADKGMCFVMEKERRWGT